jgi:hypothetical protein
MSEVIWAALIGAAATLIAAFVAKHTGRRRRGIVEDQREKQYRLVLNWDGRTSLRAFDLSKRSMGVSSWLSCSKVVF